MPLTSAVIDKHSADALLALAARERLVWSTRGTDGVLERVFGATYDTKVQEQLLEQLVLTPKVSLCGYPDFLWDALDGPLKQEGHLANLDVPDHSVVELKALPLDVMCGLIGKEIPEPDFRELLARVGAALSEESDFERSAGKSAPNILQADLRNALNTIGLEIPERYSAGEIADQRARNLIYSEFAPIAGAIQEYSTLASIADRFGLLVKTPILRTTTPTSLMNPKFEARANDSEVVLFRIVAQQLGRTTSRPSLAGSLSLASEPETARLREMLALWYSHLASGNAGELRRIQLEISSASEALKRLSGVRTIGLITTLIAVPALAAEHILHLGPALSMTIASLGVLALRSEERTRQTYLWASYGGT